MCCVTVSLHILTKLSYIKIIYLLFLHTLVPRFWYTESRMKKIFWALISLLIITSADNAFAQTAKESAQSSLILRFKFALFVIFIFFIVGLISFGVVYLVNMDREPEKKIDFFSDKYRKLVWWIAVFVLAIIITVFRQ